MKDLIGESMFREYTDIKEPEASQILEQPKGTCTDIACPDCNGVLVVREGKGKFLGCSNFPKCKTTIGLTPPNPDVGIGNLYLVNKEFQKVFNFDDDPHDWEEYGQYMSGIHCAADM